MIDILSIAPNKRDPDLAFFTVPGDSQSDGVADLIAVDRVPLIFGELGRLSPKRGAA